MTVTVATGLASNSIPVLPGRSPSPVWFVVMLPVGLLFCRKSRAAIPLLLLLLAGCGASRTLPFGATPTPPVVTPSGTYTLVVAGSSAGIVHSVNLTLTVQ